MRPPCRDCGGVMPDHLNRSARYCSPECRFGTAVCEHCGQTFLRGNPDPMYFSIDHVIPLSKGGHDHFDNVQSAHMVCNQEKKDRVLMNLGPAQA